MKCPECQMIYTKESLTDRRLHSAYHDKNVNGVSARPLRSDKVVWRQGDDRIVVVTATSLKVQRTRAAKVSRAANQEMQYDFGVYNENETPDDRDIHLFLYCSCDRAIGLSILERRTGVYYNTWEEFDNQVQKTLEEINPIWSLGFTWVHKKHRRRGIAKFLLLEAIRYLGIQINDIGIYTPFSVDGEALIRSMFREGFLVAE